jgi:class 3 adenylate cyclase/tetratricopeptide (TPR) repeat protein
MRCPSCEHENPPHARFCDQCGERQSEVIDQPEWTPAANADRGERRLLTVMFCDLVGFTSMAERIDPEDLRELLQSYHAICSDSIARFDGYVSQYLGDGVLAYFGYPIAHEDDAERAVRSALEIQHRLREGFAAGAARARIGIHTGPVVISAMGSRARHEMLALGSTTNIAARVQELADEGGVAISEATHRLTSGVFAHDLGRRELKGLHEPLRIFSARQVFGGGRRARPETPLFGRADEMERLLTSVNEARRGRGRLVWISGDAGIGKTRLVLALRAHPAAEPRSWLEVSCSHYSSGSPFRPMIELLEERLGLRDAMQPELRARGVAKRLAGIPELPLARVVPFVNELLGLPVDGDYPLPMMTPAQQRECTMEALAAIIAALAAQQLVILAVEDVHWADPSTLELLGRLAEVASRTRLLVLCNARSELAMPWPRASANLLQLQRLPVDATREMVLALRAGRRLPPALVHEIVDRSDGVPLFVEQLTQTFLESEATDDSKDTQRLRDGATIPATLQGLLTARLDRLGSAKRVAQLAATVGREFSAELLDKLGELPARSVQDGLTRLEEVGLITSVRSGPHASFRFKHALFQEAAYQSQLRADQRATHGRLAAALEQHFPALVASEPALLARHCAEARLYDKAAAHYQSAGAAAAARYSNREAVAHLRLALGALAQLPDTPARRERELAASLTLAQPLIASHRLDHSEVIALHDRIASLCSAADADLSQLSVRLYLSRYYLRRGEVDASAEVGASVLRIGQEAGSLPVEMVGRMIVGTCEITRSPAPTGIRHLERALEIAASIELPTPRSTIEPEVLAFTHATLGLALAVGGRFDDAAAHTLRARSRAYSTGHQPTCILVLSLSTVTFCMMSEFETTIAWARDALALGEGRGFHSPEAQAHVMAGWARVALGDLQGLEEAEAGLAQAEEMGFRGGLCHHITAAAEANRLAGRYERALELLEQARKTHDSTGEVVFAGRVRRSRGMVMLARGDVSQAEFELREADELLGAHGALVDQLMVATELFRLAHGRSDEAQARGRLEQLLAGIPGGDQYRPQRAARALLHQAASPNRA